MPVPVVKKVGTRLEVWNGKAIKTKGGLTKDMLVRNSAGAIVSKARSDAARARLSEYDESE